MPAGMREGTHVMASCQWMNNKCMKAYNDVPHDIMVPYVQVHAIGLVCAYSARASSLLHFVSMRQMLLCD